MSEPSGDYTATLPRKRMASAVLFTDGDGRVLLVEPSYKDYWEVPGGCVEADESPYDAVVREVTEELGVSVVAGRLLVVDWVPPRPGRTEGVMFLFDVGVLDPVRAGEIHLPSDELRSWAWCTRAEASQRLSELLTRRVLAGLLALENGATVYLENGDRVV